MSIAVIVGLGNPGSEYCGTRHNIGFEVVDAFAHAHQCAWEKARKFKALVSKAILCGTAVHLIKPQTYMNLSGQSLAAFSHFHKLVAANFLVVYDDISLETGRVKFSVSGSSGGHNGIENLLQTIGPGFSRYRIGIGAKAHPAMELSDHVLSRFNENERQLLNCRLSSYVGDLELILEGDVAKAMNHINQRSRHYESSSSHE